MRPGDVLAERFEIGALAAEGGMGGVWRAHDRRTGEPVAVKVLLHVMGDERLLREARVLSELVHPALVRYVDHGTTPEGRVFLAMEWLEGEDLAARLTRGPLTAEESASLVRRAAEALGVAHLRKMVHRDIKPGNLHLGRGEVEQVKVIDFGIAHVGGTLHGLTRTGTALGTPAYMAPEQARGERNIDARVDVFALGCVLFECLTGRPAFQGAHPIAVLAKVLLEEVPAVRSIRPDVPPSLDELVARMTSKTATSRPADAAEVARELAALERDEPLSSQGPRRAPMSLTPRERQLLVVVMTRAPSDISDAPTLLPEELEPPSVLALGVEHGAAVEVLADGSALATFRSGEGAASDRTTRAVRLALALQRAQPDLVLAVAAGRGELSGRLPIGEVIDRVAGLLEVWAGEVPVEGVPIDELTAGLLPTRFEVHGDGASLQVRGEREMADESRLLLGRPAPWVGRERELATLESLVDESAEEPKAVAALVIGEAGVGKSRLRHELLRRLQRRPAPVAVWLGRGDPMRSGSALGLVADALRRAFGIVDGEPLETRRRKVRARVSRRVASSEVARVAVFVGELLGAASPEDDHEQLAAARRETGLMGQHIRRAFTDLLEAECADAPLVLVLEDLHWGDGPSVKLVDAALRELQRLPFTALALARPEVEEIFPGLWRGRGAHTLRLEPLGRRASRALVRQVLAESTAESDVERIVERAGGNALFLEELVRAHSEGGSDEPPETVLAMVQARIERIEPDARRLLRAASAFGGSFWLGGVRALVGENVELAPWLALLVEREIVTARAESRLAGETEYTFRHALVRDAAYGMLTDEDRAVGHRLAGEWLERAGEQDAVTLAEHFEKGRAPELARAWWLRAAEEALVAIDFAGAIARADRGVALGAAGEDLGALRLVQAEAFTSVDVSRVAATAGEALRLLPEGSRAWGDAAARLSIAAFRAGDRARVESTAELLLGAAERSGSHALAPAMLRVALESLALGSVEVSERLSRSVDAGPPLLAGDLRWWHALRSRQALFAGDIGAYRHEATIVERLHRAVGDVPRALDAQENAALALVLLGAYAEAEREFASVLSGAERIRANNVVAYTRHNLGLVLGHLGRPDEALEMEARAAAEARAVGDVYLERACRLYAAVICALAGRFDEAAVEAEAAERACRQAPPIHAYATAVLAEARLACGLHREAAEAAGRAARALEALGGVQEGESTIRLVHARALAAVGDCAGARVAIASARRRLLARARKIADDDLRRSFLERVPENAVTLELAARWLDAAQTVADAPAAGAPQRPKS